MILRRIRAHVEAENWFAVAIDFAIVVVGVFIGLQVQQWASDRAEAQRIAVQLASFRDELVRAQPHVDAYAAYTQQRLSDGRQLRTTLADPDASLSEAEATRLTMSALRLTKLNIEFRAYEELSLTGSVSKIDDPDLRQQLYAWDSALAELRNSEIEAYALRDRLGFMPILDVFALGNLATSDERYEDWPSAGRFTVDMERLRQDMAFDNAVTARMISATQKLTALETFIVKSEALILKLGGEAL